MIGTAYAAALLLAGFAATDAVTASASGEPEHAEETLQGESDTQDRLTLDVAVEGQGPYRFLIDTGSQRTIVSSAMASNLGLLAGPEVTIIGTVGTRNVATAQIAKIQLGNRSVHDITAPLLEDQHIGADGILGTDSLHGQRVTFDFENNTISVNAASRLSTPNGYEIVVSGHRRLGRLLITNALIDGIRTDVIVDTGASSTVGNLALQKAMRGKLPGFVRLVSVTGEEVVAELGMARSLKIDRLNLQNVVVAFTDSPAFAELGLNKRPAILLGMRELRAFRRIAIDFSSRKVLFDLPRNVGMP